LIASELQLQAEMDGPRPLCSTRLEKILIALFDKLRSEVEYRIVKHVEGVHCRCKLEFLVNRKDSRGPQVYSPRTRTNPEISLKISARFREDRKSTRLNSSHLGISYAVFCLKKKKTKP